MNYSFDNIQQKLQKALEHDLPGAEAQDIMSPVEASEKYRQAPDNHKVACVMALFHFKEDGELYITYIRRASSHPKDKHAGQIGFPGGKYEQQDGSLKTCVLREVNEELGIPLPDISVQGQLTSLYVFASNFMVYPFVGFLDNAPRYIRQVSEVDEVIEFPVRLLLDQETKTKQKTRLSEGYSLDVPGYDLGSDFLWGATAMITSEVEVILKRCLGVK